MPPKTAIIPKTEYVMYRVNYSILEQYGALRLIDTIEFFSNLIKTI